jgi:hypothetical protein
LTLGNVSSKIRNGMGDVYKEMTRQQLHELEMV